MERRQDHGHQWALFPAQRIEIRPNSQYSEEEIFLLVIYLMLVVDVIPLLSWSHDYITSHHITSRHMHHIISHHSTSYP